MSKINLDQVFLKHWLLNKTFVEKSYRCSLEVFFCWQRCKANKPGPELCSNLFSTCDFFLHDVCLYKTWKRLRFLTKIHLPFGAFLDFILYWFASIKTEKFKNFIEVLKQMIKCRTKSDRKISDTGQIFKCFH